MLRFRPGNMTQIKLNDRRDNSGSPIGWSGNNSSAGGILFAYRHCISHDPIELQKRIFWGRLSQLTCQTFGSSRNSKWTG